MFWWGYLAGVTTGVPVCYGLFLLWVWLNLTRGG